MITASRSDDRLNGNPAVTDFLARINDTHDAARLSELNYIDLALAFASLRLPRDAGTAQVLYLQLMSGLRITDWPPDLSVAEGTVAALHDAQVRFVQWLENIRHDRSHAALRVASTLFDAGSRIVMRPTFVAGDGTVEISYQCMPADFEAALGFVLMLLVDRNRPFMGNVCRCNYSECQRYFLVVKDKVRTGRPRRNYCTKDHFSMARAATAAERIRIYRQRVRDQRKRSTRRKPK